MASAAASVANYGFGGGGGINGRPPGSFALPGIHSVAAAVAARKQAESPDPESGPNKNRVIEMNSSGATTSSSTIRHIHSPDATNHVHSPLNGGVIGISGFPAGMPGPHGLPPHPGNNGREASPKNERPSSLGSVIGVNPSINNNNNHSQSGKGSGKKTRWLLCYPSGGAASSESPSPPHEEAPGGPSNASTPSPTDGGFKIPNSQSNERPTSLPVALLNSSQRNGKF